MAGGLQSNYGGAAIQAAYQDSNPVKSFGDAFNSTKEMLSPFGEKGGNIGSILKNPELAYRQPQAQQVNAGGGLGNAPAVPKVPTGQFSMKK